MTTRATLTGLLLLLTACPQKGPPGPVDFTKLVSEAYPTGGKRNNDKTEELWLELNKLPRWHFTTTKDLVAQKQPSIELLSDGSWLIASTDLQIALAYAERRGRALAAPPAAATPPPTTGLPPSPFEVAAAPTAAPVAAPDAAVEPPKPNPYVADDGTALVVTMTPDEAVAYLKGYSGPPLAGVRFNEGAPRNFFGDIDAVVNIRTALTAKGAPLAPPQK